MPAGKIRVGHDLYRSEAGDIFPHESSLMSTFPMMSRLLLQQLVEKLLADSSVLNLA